MADRSPPTKQHVDRDGVRTIEGSGIRRSVWLLALAAALVGLAVFVVVGPAFQRVLSPPSEAPTAERSANGSVTHTTAAPPQRPAAAAAARTEVPRPPAPESRPESRRAAPPPQPTVAPEAAAEAPAKEDSEPATDADSEQTTNEPTGLALFPPPGTKPIKRGIVVPEGVELPPGYVRHYQTTDDGHQLPPILMFHPDYQPVDEHGDLIPLPDDRVVPTEMAPAGIPIQMLDVPENATPAIGASRRGQSNAQQ